MNISRKKYWAFFFGTSGGLLAGVGLSQGGFLFTLLALAFLWASKGFPTAGCLWGGGATLFSHRWLLALHPLTWLGIPEWLSLPIAVLIWLSCGMFGALLVGCWCFLGNTSFFNKTAQPSIQQQFLVAFALALIWALIEVCLTKSPMFWVGLSVSFLPQDRWLVGLARWIGAGGVVTVQLLMGWWLWQLGVAKVRGDLFLRLLAWGSFVVLLIHFLGWQLISNDQFSSTKRIALWQTNIPTREKFTTLQLKRLPESIQEALEQAEKLNSDFLVAPEGTMQAGQRLASPSPIPFLTGGFRWIDSKQRSALLVFREGETKFKEVIDKYRLVPLGEWLPSLPGITPKGLSFVGGLEPGKASRLLRWNGPPVGVAICYELSDGNALAKATMRGAEWILSIANLDPYPLSLQKQFIALAQLRSIELARDVITVANTGPTSLVLSSGEFISLIPPFKNDVASIDVHLSNKISGYARWKELPLITSLIITLFAISRLKKTIDN